MKARRLRTLTLWTGTLLSLLIAAAFVVSAWWRVSIQFDAMCIIVQDGGVAIQRGVVFSNPVTLERFPGLRHWNRWRFNWPWSAAAPLYALFAAVAVPTLLVWRFWPKPVKPGHCRCGYKLKGLTEARFETGEYPGRFPNCDIELGDINADGAVDALDIELFLNLLFGPSALRPPGPFASVEAGLRPRRRSP